MSLGPIRSEIRSVTLKRSAGTAARAEKPCNNGVLQQETSCRRRREYYTSANGDRRSLYRSETSQSDPFRNSMGLDTGFVAQVIGQILPAQTAPDLRAYADTARSSIRALLLDRSV